MTLHTANNLNKPAAAPPAPTPDLIGFIIGDFGIWQLRTVLIIFLCKIPASWFMACIIFTAPELYPGSEFECDTDAFSNATVTADQCYIETEDSPQECSNFKYHFDFYSLVMQFNLVCNRDIFVAWTQFWHLFGILVGGVVGTKMMLWLSPRTTMFIGMVLQIICGCVTGFARDFSLHCAFRCLSAVCCAIMFTAGQTIFSDITAGAYRLGAVILYDTFWSIGLFLLPGLSSFFRNWTEIYLGITFPTLALILLLNWTPDSPRWLLRNGSDIKQVEDIIREAAKINDREFKIPPDFTEQLRLQSESLKANPPKQATWLELWSGPRAKTHFIAAHIALAAFIINFMGMLLNIRSFGRDYLSLNTIIIGFSEIVGCFLALHFTLKHNRWKWQLAGGFNIVAGLIGFTGWAFSDSMDKRLLASLWIIIAAIPKAGVSLAQSMILACLAELVPVHKKAPFMFSVVTWARIWLLSAPFVNVLKKIAVAMSLSAFCLLSIIGGICLCCLLTPRPSTSTHTMQNGVTDMEPEVATTESTTDICKEVWTVEVYENVTRL